MSWTFSFSQKAVAADPVDGTTIVNSFAVLLLGNTCTTGSMLPPVATSKNHVVRQHHVVRAFSYLNYLKKNLESICCPSYEMNAGFLASMGFNNMMHAI